MRETGQAPRGEAPGRSYFRAHPADCDPSSLLDPDQQQTEPWGGPDRGRCPKCGGSGSTNFECRTCAAHGPDPACPACSGRVTFEGRCPACKGSGVVERERRRGMSVFPDEEALYRYLLDRDARLEQEVLLELEGERSAEQDFDADEGALLIRPTRIVAVRPLDRRLLDALRSDARA